MLLLSVPSYFSAIFLFTKHNEYDTKCPTWANKHVSGFIHPVTPSTQDQFSPGKCQKETLMLQRYD